MARETQKEIEERTFAILKLGARAPEPPQGAAPAATVKNARRRRSDPGIILVSLEERAHVAAFIRLIRSNYWLAHFVKECIRLDANSPDLVGCDEVERQLRAAKDIEELVGKIQYIGKQGWWRDHPVINAIAEEWDEVLDYRSMAAVRKLLESARAEKVKR